MSTEINREKIARRIKALLAKSVENGATEGEAMAAALKAKEMMQQYGIGSSEAELFAEGLEEIQAEDRGNGVSIQFDLAHAIEQFTCTIGFRRRKQSLQITSQNDLFGSPASDYRPSISEHIVFFGAKPDAVFARWLLGALESFIIRKSAEFKAQYERERTFEYGSCDNGLVGRGRKVHRPNRKQVKYAVESFQAGRISRISLRLLELADVDEEKMRALNRALKDRGVHLKHTTANEKRYDRAAFTSGAHAGDEARFNRPVNNGNGVRALTGR